MLTFSQSTSPATLPPPAQMDSTTSSNLPFIRHLVLPRISNACTKLLFKKDKSNLNTRYIVTTSFQGLCTKHKQSREVFSKFETCQIEIQKWCKENRIKKKIEKYAKEGQIRKYTFNSDTHKGQIYTKLAYVEKSYTKARSHDIWDFLIDWKLN